MLLSTLISLTPTVPVLILGPLGRPAQGWFLHQVRRLDARLSEKLHQRPRPRPTLESANPYDAVLSAEESGMRPYNLSTLLDGRGRPLPPGLRLLPGAECWLRIGSLTEELSAFLLERALPRLPNRIELYKMPFRVEGYTHSPVQHPWAGSSTFRELSEVGAEAPASSLRLEFASPTAFRQGELDIPLPDPGQIQRSLWRRWNTFAPEPLRLHAIWPEFAAACLMVSELVDLNTTRWEWANGAHGVETGFTGQVELSLRHPEKMGVWKDFWEGAPQVLQTLGRFAQYAGVGHHTSVGMGQARKLTDWRAPRPERP